jgi:hypothetical protein
LKLQSQPEISTTDKMRVFENKMLARTSEPKKEDVTGERRTLRNKVIYSLYSLPNSIKMIKSRKGGYEQHITEKQMLARVAEPERKSTLGRHKH